MKRSLNQGGPFVTLHSPLVPFYTDTTGVGGTYYWYSVSTIAVNGAESEPVLIRARKLPVDAGAPASPTSLSVIKTGGSSTFLNWDDNIESDLAGYWITGATTSGGTFVSLSAQLLSASEYGHLVAAAPNTWFYRVYAADESGNLSAPATTDINITSPDITAPATPTGLSLNPQASGIGLLWISNSEPDLSYYIVERSLTGAGAWSTVATVVPANVSDTGATSGVVTFYRISARDLSGNISGYLTGSDTRPTEGPITDLTPFLKKGTMVPTAIHCRGVNLTRYRLSSGVFVSNETADFKVLPAGTPLTARYDWNFASGSGQPRGLYPDLRGFNAAHAYDSSGSYTITLTRTAENGVVDNFRATVTLAGDTRTAVYVSATSTVGTGSGTSAAPVTVARAQQLLDQQDAVKVLLKNGDNFNVGSTFLTLKRPNQMVSNFRPTGGVTTLPKITFNTSNNSVLRRMFVCTTGALNPVFENFQVDQNYTGGDRGFDHVIYFNSTSSGYVEYNALIRNLTYVRCGRGVNPDETYYSTRYILMQDCRFPLQSANSGGLQNYAMWVTGADIVILGIVVDESQDEHCLRTGPVDRVLYSHCSLKNFPYGGTVSKQGIRISEGRYHYVHRCELISKPVLSSDEQSPGHHDFGPIEGQQAKPATSVEWLVVERCRVEGMMKINPGLHYGMFRNNVVFKGGNQCFEIIGRGTGTNETLQSLTDMINHHIYIYNNTMIHFGTYSVFLKNTRKMDQLEVWNNLAISTSLTSGTLNIVSGFGTGCRFSRNTWGKGGGGTLNRFTYNGVVKAIGAWNAIDEVAVGSSVGEDRLETVGYNSTNFRIPTAAPAATYAAPRAGVFEDYEGSPRLLSDVNWACGALETTT